MVNVRTMNDSKQKHEDGWKKECLRILTVNDVYSFDSDDCDHGGWSKISTLINELRTENTIVTVNGDFLGGASLLQQTKGQVAIDIMNAVHVDAVVLGNHEFDYGDEALKERMEASEFVWLGSNVEQGNGDLFPGVTDVLSWPLQQNSNYSIQLFGLCTPATPHLSYPSPTTKFANIHTTTQRVLSSHNENNDVLCWIALTHLSMHQDIELAKQQSKTNKSPPIQLILGGHDHDPMAMDINHTLVFKCGQNGYWVGCVDLHIHYPPPNIDNHQTQQKPKIYYSYSMHSTAQVLPDPNIQTIIQSHHEEQKQLNSATTNKIVATIASGCFDTRTSHVRRMESTSGNIIADAMLWYYTRHRLKIKNNEHWCAMINGGFIRGDSTYSTHLTLQDVMEELPFPKDICCLQIKGKHLQLALQQQLQPVPAATASFPHVSRNVKMIYSTRTQQISSFIIDNESIHPDKIYNVIISAFIASGGDGCTAWSDYGKKLSLPYIESKRIALVILDYLQHHPKLHCHLQNRTTIIS